MSSRGLVRSMMITGGAQAVSILLAILRMKVLAVLLGPAGVGLLGIYNNLLGVVGGVAGLGMGSSGVRQIAAARDDAAGLGRVRRVLFVAHLVQGVIAMVAVWLLREPIAVWLLGDVRHATEIGLVGVAVLFALMGAAQTALLRGMRRIGDLGRVTVLGALAGTVVGIAAVWREGSDGLIWFLLAEPLTAFLVALVYVRRLPEPAGPRLGASDLWREWKPMVRLGSVFMLGGLVTTATLLVVRGRLTQDLGLEAAGQFAAAWGITITYVGFLLGAMGADYYPRLTEVIRDREAATRLMNDQAQLGLALGGPVLLLLIGLAPLAIRLLYSAEFEDAVPLLQWQTAGNVFKLASWPLGFAFVAAARSGVFLFTEVSWNLLFLGLFWIGLPVFGLEVTGMAFLVSYAAYFVILNILARRLHGFRWEGLSLKLLGVHAGLALVLLALALAAPLAGAVAAVGLAVVTGLVGGRIVLIKIGAHGRAAPLARLYRSLGWPIPTPA